jgi:uncharacterized protein YndB with AHSA1/START domain
MRLSRWLVGIVLGIVFLAPAIASSDRVLRAEMTIAAPIADVWKAWTTDEGIATFFAPAGRVDLRVDGTYDIWFDPKGKPGERGAEGMRILDVDPMRRFAFTWNAPPSIPSIRGKRTVVVVELEAAGERATKLTFTESCWGVGPDWDEAYDYFDHAWGGVVLPRLKHRFEVGPVSWEKPPDLPRISPTMKVDLARRAS